MGRFNTDLLCAVIGGVLGCWSEIKFCWVEKVIELFKRQKIFNKRYN